MTSRPSVIAVLVLMCGLAAGCTSDGPAITMNPEPGISRELARSRAASIRNLRYDLSLTIPARPADPVTGEVVVRFTDNAPSGPLVVDFAPDNAVGPAPEPVTVVVNNLPVDATHINGHIQIPSEALQPGDNSVQIGFIAGDAALHRNTEFMYSLFVPALAHTVFPVFDQPDLKARFTLELDIPNDWTAVANGPEVSREDSSGRVRVRFAETAPIPTYLFAFAAGQFDVIDAERNGRALRMLHRESDGDKVARNLDAVFDLHHTALDQLETYTGIPYPFAKFAFVLVPAFEFGGMEHPGAVFYRDSSILLEETATEEQQLQRASLIAHETAHMWFGDLVTMEWFNDVWMKEVFANFMAGKIVNPSFPGVRHDLLFLTRHYPAAYGVDRTEGTHPIRQELDNLNAAGSLYGPIIYEKAPIVMAQLERMIGEAAFQSGVRAYLDDFRFANATWPDLVARLDRETPIDIAAWSQVWVEAAGRPRIETVVERDTDGRIRSISIDQADTAGRGLIWPQSIELLVGDAGTQTTIPVDLDGPRIVIDGFAGMRPEFALPSGGGLIYGNVVLDPVSRQILIDRFPTFDDPLIRGVIWVTLREEMLDGRVRPTALLDLALNALPVEATEQLVTLLVDGVASNFWRHLSPSDREAYAPRIETTLRAGLAAAETASLKSAYFRTFSRVATTPEGIRFLEEVWRGETAVPGLTFSEIDETGMAEQLALRSHPEASEILATQLERIGNPDRRDRFQFVIPSLSADPATRERFFRSLADPANRRREPWVADGLAFLNHPLRARSAEPWLRQGLAQLPEIQDTGDIFFPSNWTAALLTGHRSPEAAQIVRGFLDGAGGGFPASLRRVILQAADPLFRVVRNEEGSGE